MNIRPLLLASLLASGAAALPALAEEFALMTEARAAATSLPPRLVSALNDEIAKSGPEGAIPVCRDMAPRMAKEVAATTGWQLKRVTLKSRNPERSTPDTWERGVLEEFERRAAAGENPATLEKGEMVEQAGGNRVFRYAKALPTQPLCLNCHGADDKLTPAVKARLSEHYPQDRATGYREGQIRGAVVASKPF